MRKELSGSVLLAASVAGLGAAATGAQPGLAASAATWRTQVAIDPTGAIGLAAATLLWLLIGLVAVGVVATVLSRLPGVTGACFDLLSKRLLPTAMRRALHLMIGVTVGVTALAPAGAWASTVAAVRPSVSISAPADTLPNPLPSLGEPGGVVTMPTPSAPAPQVAADPTATPTTSSGTPGTPAPTEVAPALPTAKPASEAPTPIPPPNEASPSQPAAAPVPTATPTNTAPSTAPSTARTIKPAAPQAIRTPARRQSPATRAPAGMDPTMTGAFTVPAASAVAPGDVAVAPGDSLWVLAARDLARRDGGAMPGNATIAAEWPRWWAANRAAIGADPNLLVPGQQLTPPA